MAGTELPQPLLLFTTSHHLAIPEDTLVMYRAILITLICIISQAGCSSSDSNSGKPAGSLAPEYGLTEKPYTSLQQVWAPKEPSPEVRAMMDDGRFTVYEHQRYAENGLGASLEAGIPWIEHRELAPGFPGEGNERQSLAYILAIADPQIIDEESPIRMDGYSLVYRPHGQLTPQLFEAHVRTAQRISDHSSRPFDFTVIAGDLTDTSQQNELEWMIAALNGGVIDPDSGINDDPDPGPGNDYNDPFFSRGLDSPWYAALGNHDVLHVGGFGPIDEKLRDAARDDHLFTDSTLASIWGGYVAGDTIDHQVILDESVITPADDARLPLDQRELLQALYDAGGNPAGHGLSQDDVTANRGYFSVNPLPGKPIRMIVLDTTDEEEMSLGRAQQGSMDAVQFSWLHEALVAAEILEEQGVGLAVVNMPWLNRFDTDWLAGCVAPYQTVYVLEDHAPVGGLGDRLLATMHPAGLLADREVKVLGVEGYPVCGTPVEALRAHALDGASLAARVLKDRR